MQVRLGDTAINYNVAGDGHPLVLIHGARSNSSHFEFLAAELAKSFKVYWYDLRGYGKTEWPAETPLSHALWQGDLTAFLDHFGIKKAALVGWSMGTRIALDYALRRPAQVSHLVLLGAPDPLKGSNPDKTALNERLNLVMNAKSNEDIVAETWESAKGIFSRYSQEQHPEALERVRQEHLTTLAKSHVETLRANDGEPPLTETQLKSITCPTLVVVGEADARNPAPISEKLNRLIPNSYMKVMPDVGHYFSVEQPQATAATITKFLGVFGAPVRS